MNLFYKPEGAWAADFIPFYKDGRYHLFYLLDWRDPAGHGEGTPWYQISTPDFTHFTEHGEMLARGRKDEQDLYVFTGSVIQGEGQCHIFYTGHNPYFRKEGKPEQGIMHAVSLDLLHWTKVPQDTFYADTSIYEPNDWRDPFVFWNADAKEYWMLTAARLREGPSRRRGCTALCTSKDLKHWDIHPPFWAPGLYFTHECPDLFRIGDWWYLVYSTFTERCVTHYRMSHSLQGPWTAPENDTFDGRAFYAAKTVGHGSPIASAEHRFIFGWNPTREGKKDYQPWHWGGNLVVHELIQEKDGTLSVRVPETLDRLFWRKLPAPFTSRLGQWSIQDNSLSVEAPGSFACATASEMPPQCKISTNISFGKATRGCGVMLRTSDDLENAYYIRLEPGRNRLVLDSWPRAGDNPFMVELERPLELVPGHKYELKIFVEDSICEVYLDKRIAMSARLYNLSSGKWGVFVNEGSALFDTTEICGL